MAKTKTCSFCKEDVPRLYYSNPKCCFSWSCRRAYAGLKHSDDPVGRKEKKVPQIAQNSPKRLKQLAEYRKRRTEYLEDNPSCEVHISKQCMGKASEIHHKWGKIGNDLIDVNNFIAICRPCHNWVHENDAEARAKGLLISRLNKYND